ncbi:MAG: hypothetical protein JXL84_21800, partial [Deltaproteobacteria bacterium]|nr:hypothetical protein [Deltaproteobacteria bacterium]
GGGRTGRNYFSHASNTGPPFCVSHKKPQAATPKTGYSPVPATVIRYYGAVTGNVKDQLRS